jgi:outer membrane protein assembly factor BamD
MLNYHIMKRIILLAVFISLSLAIGPAYSYWIWTPKTGKWVNPKTAVKSTPKDQFDFAKELYGSKNFEEAKREFKKLLKNYPKSAEAAEGQYYLALIEEDTGNLYQAFQAYQKVIDKYPFSERIQEINDREFKIGEAFMAGEKRKAMGLEIPVENPAIEIFSKIIENSTYGPLASKAQYKLGLVLKGLSRYYEAEDAFNKVISNYPDSEWIDAAKFQIASCRQAVSRGSAYDQGASKEAQEKFEEFVREHPDASLSVEAEKNINDLKDRETESSYNIGRFYEKQKEYSAAKLYYDDIISNDPNGKWAAKAAERLQVIESLEKKNAKK